MKTHQLKQGSPEWAAHRLQYRNASDAPVVMGATTLKTRNQLLREAYLGIAPEIGDWKQALYDSGHAFEALARPLAEEFIGEALYPVVGTTGLYSASFDGITMDERIAFEHKRLNAPLREAFGEMRRQTSQDPINAGHLIPLQYRIQMEQQLLVSAAEKVLFMASLWEGQELIEKSQVWYYPDEALRAQIVAAWEQFDADLAAYVPPAEPDVAPVGRAPDLLPALRIEVSGQVTASNLAEFRETALGAIRSVNKDLQTDADFANAEASVKWCTDVESRLAAAKEHALSQTASIDVLFKTIDDISAEARKVRLDLSRLVTARKETIRGDIVAGALRGMAQHINALNARFDRPLMPNVLADFAGVIKGKRTVASLQNAVDTELARGKIEASAIAHKITANLRQIDVLAAPERALFSDVAQLVLKAPDDLAAVIAVRLAAHKEAEEKRIEADRERIREEETARLHREATAAAAATAAIAAAQAPAVPAPGRPMSAPLVLVAQTQPETAAVAIAEPPTVKCGDINKRLGFLMTAEFIADTLGVPHSGANGNAKLWTEAQFLAICTALHAHIDRVANA